jgi:hypothetical protein
VELVRGIRRLTVETVDLPRGGQAPPFCYRCWWLRGRQAAQTKI